MADFFRLLPAALVLLTAAPAVAQQDGATDADQPTQPKQTTRPDLGGTWAQRVVTTAVSKVPIIGEVITRTVSVQVVQISQDGENLDFESHVCNIRVHTSVDSVKTHIPRGFIEAMGTIKRPAKLVARDGGGFVLHVPRQTEVLGVNLREPKSEYLPTDPDDPRVVDQDKDGHPGVTVRVSGLIDGKLYIAHRGWDRLRGELRDADHIVGGVDWGQQQVVLDSTSIFLGNSPDSKPHPSAKKNFFEMRRVDAGTDCAAIMKERVALFTRR